MGGGERRAKHRFTSGTRPTYVELCVSWVSDAVTALSAGREVHVRPRGGSMRGRIEDNQLVTIAPVDVRDVVTGDVVLVRWKASFLLHLVKEARAEDLLIGNNLGRINGWAKRRDVLGRVTKIHAKDVVG